MKDNLKDPISQTPVPTKKVGLGLPVGATSSAQPGSSVHADENLHGSC